MTPRRHVIINADDLGASEGINRGIVQGVEAGIVTSASLMVNMGAARHATTVMADHPAVSIGIHVNFTFEDVAPIVDFDDPEACRRELDRQIELFVTLVGRTPTHLDAHHNVHRDERLAPIFVAAAHVLEIPLREHGPVTYFSNFYGQWDGDTHAEHITSANLLAMVAGFGPGITELACHPGRPEPEFVSGYHSERHIELDTLLSPGLRGDIEALGVELISYHDVPRPR